MKDEKLKDIELEKDVIYGLIKHPEVFLENQNLVKEDAFTHPTHKIVFQVFKNNILNSDATDIVTLARRCQKEGLQDKDGVPIFEYLENSLYTAITRDGLLELIRDLHWFAYLRFEWRKCYEAACLALKSKKSSSKTNILAPSPITKPSSAYHLSIKANSTYSLSKASFHTITPPSLISTM